MPIRFDEHNVLVSERSAARGMRLANASSKAGDMVEWPILSNRNGNRFVRNYLYRRSNYLLPMVRQSVVLSFRSKHYVWPVRPC